ncbi:hypothetical protein H4R35_001954 [Dimargaris xerosporica]|nr:hypothetical protein H4R35_001954 [Dimargaris xerosporica]
MSTLTPDVLDSLHLYLTHLLLTEFHMLLQSTLLSVYKAFHWSTAKFETIDYELLSDTSVCERNLILCVFKKNRGKLVEPILTRLSQGLGPTAMSPRGKCDLLVPPAFVSPRRSVSVPKDLSGKAGSRKPSVTSISIPLSDKGSFNPARRKSSPSELGWKLPCATRWHLWQNSLSQVYTALVYQLAKDIAAEIAIDWASDSVVTNGQRILEKAFQSDSKLALQLHTQHAVWSLELMWQNITTQTLMEKAALHLVSNDCALAYQYHYCTGLFWLDARQAFDKYIPKCPREPYFRQAQSELEHQPRVACQALLHLPPKFDFTTAPHHLLLVTDWSE